MAMAVATATEVSYLEPESIKDDIPVAVAAEITNSDYGSAPSDMSPVAGSDSTDDQVECAPLNLPRNACRKMHTLREGCCPNSGACCGLLEKVFGSKILNCFDCSDTCLQPNDPWVSSMAAGKCFNHSCAPISCCTAWFVTRPIRHWPIPR